MLKQIKARVFLEGNILHGVVTKKEAKNTKKIPAHEKKFVVQQHIKCFKFIMNLTRGKTCGFCRRNGTITENRGL